MRGNAPTPVVELADAQHGVVSGEQLRRLGLSARSIDGRVQRGALRRLHAGIYAVRHLALRAEGRWLAAVLACGDGAVLSHLPAARLWSMSSVPADLAVHVTILRGDRKRPGIVVHRAVLTGADVTRQHGVPTTTPARTLVDLADVVPYATLRRIGDRGVRLDVAAVRRGRGAIARLLGDDGTEVRTRSGLERRLRRLVRDVGLPAPIVNHRIAGRERDFAWPGLRLGVEVDGHAYHAPRGDREDDHDRDAELVAAGWRVLRFTDRQLAVSPAAVVARISAAAAPPPPPASAGPRGHPQP